MSAEERELMEEVEAIKEAQMVAREVFEVPKEKHPREAKQAQGKASACSKGRGGNPSHLGPRRGPWRAGWRVQPCRGELHAIVRQCALVRTHLLGPVCCERRDRLGSTSQDAWWLGPKCTR